MAKKFKLKGKHLLGPGVGNEVTLYPMTVGDNVTIEKDGTLYSIQEAVNNGVLNGKDADIEAAEAATNAANFAAEYAKQEGDKAAVLNDKVDLHQQLIGPYAKRIFVTLDHTYATNKALVVNERTGMLETVGKTGWGVTRLTAEALKAQHVDQGDTAFVYMLDAEGRNLNEDGIKVFVIETEVKGEDGQVIRRTLTSKFNAPNADVTLSGHLQTGYDLQPDQNLLICHPLSTSSVEFLRTAEGAKEATTKLNLTQQMEKLATKEGVFLQMIAGLAEGIWDTNPESGNAREWLVGRPVIGCPDLVIPRMNDIDARSGQNKDIVVDKVAGGVVGGNQILPTSAKQYNSGGVIGRVSNGKLSFKGSLNEKTGTTWPCGNAFNTGHRHLVCFGKQVPDCIRGLGEVGNVKATSSITNVVGNNMQLYIYWKGETMMPIGTNVDFETDIAVLDLTLLFPLDQPFVTSLGEDDATRVLTRLGIIALDD